MGRLLLNTAEAWMTDEAPRLSAALAFFTMLSLSPLLIIATSVAGVFYEEEAARTELVNQVRDLSGPEGANVVQNALENASFTTSGNVWSGVVAGFLLLFTSTAVFVQLQSALNKVWNTQPGEMDIPIWKFLLLIRGRSLALVLALGFLLIVSLLAGTALAILEDTVAGMWSGLDEVLRLGYNLTTVLIIGSVFFLMFRFLPDTEVDTKAAVIGGLTTALLLTIGKWGIGLYLGNSAVASAYGAAGSLVAFLLWIYFSAMVFFFGAEFTHTLSEDRRERKSGAA